jgi:hypothetical protein
MTYESVAGLIRRHARAGGEAVQSPIQGIRRGRKALVSMGYEIRCLPGAAAPTRAVTK